MFTDKAFCDPMDAADGILNTGFDRLSQSSSGKQHLVQLLLQEGDCA